MFMVINYMLTEIWHNLNNRMLLRVWFLLRESEHTTSHYKLFVIGFYQDFHINKIHDKPYGTGIFSVSHAHAQIQNSLM